MLLHGNAALSLNERRVLCRRVVDENWSLSSAAAAAEPAAWAGSTATSPSTTPPAWPTSRLGRLLCHGPARVLVLAHSSLRAVLLGAVAALDATGALHPAAYVALLAGSARP